MGRTPEELFAEREKRIAGAIALGRPDRVPVVSLFDFFPSRYRGITVQEAMYDPDKMARAWSETYEEFAPDACDNPFPLRQVGAILDPLDFRQLRWAGRGLGPDASYQFVEKEYMREDEYDAFLLDPTDFVLRTYWPRICGALEPLAKLPPFHTTVSYASFSILAALVAPELEGAWRALRRSGEEAAKMLAAARAFVSQMAGLGFPMLYGGTAYAPFDMLGDFFRGTRGLAFDLFRRPAKVEAALEKFLPMMIRQGVEGAKRTGIPRVFIPLHRGSDGFLSRDHFARFYWPGLRDVMLALIAEGLTPMVFVEGNFSTRLDFLAQMPPGKVCYHLERTPMELARETLRGIACLRGGVPISLLVAGTPEEVRACCRELIEGSGPEGGFILDTSTVLTDARPENVRALYEFAKEPSGR
ncbi:MAG: hypothetical protein HY900_37255 [Deltaproteobacteria bacterium]|nr:hypothetical protein [Deltaproteobacteria bacterium]